MQRRELPVRPVDDGWLVIDARRLTFACPLDLAAVVALAHAAADDGTRLALITPGNVDVTSYLQRMDVIRRLPTGSMIDGQLPGERRTDLSHLLMEVTQVTPDRVEDVVTRVGRMITTHFEQGVRGRVFQAVGELIDNAVSHGASDLGAFMAAQAYTGTTSRRPGLEFAICDTGIGVLAHLRRNPIHQDLSDARAALARALQPGATGTAEQRGYGLDDLLRVTRDGGVARLVLRSGNGIANVVVRLHERRMSYVSSDAQVGGTWAWLRVRYP